MEEGKCDGCDFKGMVYDHMGDYFCPKCADKAFAEPIYMPQNMDAVVEQLSIIYDYEARKHLITALERAWKAGKTAGLMEVSKHSNNCLKCGDCSELDAILPEAQ